MERLKTSSDAEDIFAKLHRASGIRRNFWARTAIGLSLSLSADVPDAEALDTGGMELTRQMLFSDDHAVILALLRERHQCQLADDAELSQVVRAHVERGARLLREEYERLNRRGDELMLQLAARCSEAGDAASADPLPPPHARDGSYTVTLDIGKQPANGDAVSHILNQPGVAPHVAIMGRNGTGKIRTALALLERIQRSASYPVPVLVFDYAKGDIASNTEFVRQIDATVIGVPGQRIPLAPLALRNTDENEIGMAAHRFRDTIAAVVRGLGAKQKSRCLDIIRDAYDEAGPETIGLDDVYNVGDRLYNNNGWPHDSLLAALKEMIDFPLFQPATGTVGHSLYERSHIIDVHGLPEDLRKLGVFLVLDKLYSELMAFEDAPLDSEGYRQHRLLIVIDEAHHYLACKQPTLEKMIREVRSKGVGIWLLSQSPDDFDQPKYNFAREMGLAIVFACVLERPKMLEALLGSKLSPHRLSQLPPGVALTRLPSTNRAIEVQAWTP